jgi:hypothetical protein
MNRIRQPTPHPQQEIRTSANQRQATVISTPPSLLASSKYPRTTTRQVGETAGVSALLRFQLPDDNVGLPMDHRQTDTVAEHVSLFPDEFARLLRNS